MGQEADRKKEGSEKVFSLGKVTSLLFDDTVGKIVVLQSLSHV